MMAGMPRARRRGDALGVIARGDRRRPRRGAGAVELQQGVQRAAELEGPGALQRSALTSRRSPSRASSSAISTAAWSRHARRGAAGRRATGDAGDVRNDVRIGGRSHRGRRLASGSLSVRVAGVAHGTRCRSGLESAMRSKVSAESTSEKVAAQRQRFGNRPRARKNKAKDRDAPETCASPARRQAWTSVVDMQLVVASQRCGASLSQPFSVRIERVGRQPAAGSGTARPSRAADGRCRHSRGCGRARRG